MAGNYRSNHSGIGRAISKGVRTLRNTKDMARMYEKSRADRKADTKERQERKGRIDQQTAIVKGNVKIHVERETAKAKGSQQRRTKTHAGNVKVRTAEAIKTLKPTPKKNDKKVGRNDPCPCGSGKKYKQCHGK